MSECKVSLVFENEKQKEDWLSSLKENQKYQLKKNENNTIVFVKDQVSEKEDNRQLKLPFGKIPNCS